jgi:hypothetical protein
MNQRPFIKSDLSIEDNSLLTRINLLEKQLQKELTRLKQAPFFNLEKEQARLEIYQRLVQNI